MPAPTVESSKPVILSIDDDPQVLRAIRRDLRTEYAEQYRLLSASSGAEALEVLTELKQRGDNVALLLSDQRMPGMDGITFLAQARKIYPQAKRFLLTAYADTNAAISAINEVGLDYYLTKPWDPPTEKLYPTLTPHLEAWLDEHIPEFGGIKVIGYRYDPQTHTIKDFLAGNRVPYQYIDLQAQPELAQELLEMLHSKYPTLLSRTSADYPLCLPPNAEPLRRPDIRELADALDMHTTASDELYDVAIIGGGPAGLAAAVYGGSEGLKAVLIERHAPGGQAGTSSRIENYLGFPTGVSGSRLSTLALDQVKRFNVEILAPKEVKAIVQDVNVRRVEFTDGTSLRARAAVITTGVSYRPLPAAGAERFWGAGVYYGAATTEAQGCINQHVAVIGGGNSAGQGAVYLSRYAKTVSIYIRKPDLSSSMSSYLIEQINAIDNIEVVGHRQVKEVLGDTRVEAIVLEKLDTAEINDCYREAVDSVFVFIGAHPHTDWLDGLVTRDERGFLLTGQDLRTQPNHQRRWKKEREPYLLETDLPGVFAAGDVRAGAMNRVASAVGEGSMAIKFVHEFLAEA